MSVALAMAGLSLYQGYLQSQGMQAEASLQEANADYLEQQAEYALYNAERQEEAYRIESDKVISSVQGQVAHSGFDFDGSDYQIVEDAIKTQTRNIADIKEQGRREAELASMKAESARMAARGLRSQSKYAMFGGALGAGASYASYSK